MKAYITSILLIFFTSLPAICDTTKFDFTNSFVFFKQDALNPNALPTSLSQKQQLQISVDIEPEDARTLRKVFMQKFQQGDLQAKIEIYYFKSMSGNYFSQQLEISHDKNIIAKCTSYFSIAQDFLVPGACSGRSENFFWGMSLYRG